MTQFTTTLRSLAKRALAGEFTAALLTSWLDDLRNSIDGSLPSEQVLQRRLAQTLGAKARQATSPSRIKKTQPGVGVFTAGQVQPYFRKELDKRIFESANLIKLDRERRVAETLQRFSGWLSSIPEGGTEAAKPRKQIKDIAAPIHSTLAETHRVAQDQGHKLMASISATLALQTDAIAGKWRSHGRLDPSYDARPDHLARDGKIYVIRGSWADDERLIKHPNGYTDEIEMVGEAVNCLVGDSQIHLLDNIRKVYRRRFAGDVIEIIAHSGRTLRATPNHPVLTPHGWVAAASLHEGDYVVCANLDAFSSAPRERDNDCAHTTIAELFASSRELVAFERLRGMRHQFHGDGSDADVDVVDIDRHLLHDQFSRVAQLVGDKLLAVADNFAPRKRALYEFLTRCAFESPRGVCGVGVSTALLRTPGRDDAAIGLQSPTLRASSLMNTFHDQASRHAVAIRDRHDAFARLMRATDADGINSNELARYERVTAARSFSFSGHVYNLETANGWYTSNGIITHNCRCWYQWKHSLSQLPAEFLTARGVAALEASRVPA